MDAVGKRPCAGETVTVIRSLLYQWGTGRPQTWLRPAIILAVLFLAAQLGSQATPGLVLLLTLAMGGLLAFIVLARWPALGVLALAPASFLMPWEIGTGTQTSFNAPILLTLALLALWVVDMLRRKEVRLVPSPVNLPLLLFVLSATISLLGGDLPHFLFAEKASLFAQIGGWLLFVLSAGVFLLVGNHLKDLRWLEALTWFLMIIGAAVTGYALLFGGIGGRLLAQGSTGALFWTWLVALSGGQALFNHSLGPGRRLALGGLVLAVLLGGWMNRSWASGWLPPFVALVVILGLRSWRLGVVVVVIAAAGMWVFAPSLPADLIAGNQYSIETRRVAWQIVLDYVLPASPLLGLGPSNYYHYTALYPILGWYVKFNSHNQYVDILAQTGIVGLAVFTWLIVAIGHQGWRLRKRVEDGFSRGYVHGCLGGLAGVLAAGFLGDWFIPFVYNIGWTGFRASMLGWLFLGGLVALEQILAGSKLPESYGVFNERRA